MSLSPISYYLPFKRFNEGNRRRLEGALREALAARGGGTFRAEEAQATGLSAWLGGGLLGGGDDDDDGDEEGPEAELEYELRFAGSKARGSFEARPGDEELAASLVVLHDDNALQDERVYEVLGDVTRRLSGWTEEHFEEMVAALREQPLPTWAAVAACAADELELVGEEDGWFAATVDPDGGQVVRASLFEDDEGAGWLVLRATAFPSEALPPREALELNATQDFAALSLAGPEYELVYSFPLSALTRGRLVDLMRWMGEEAVALREDLEDPQEGDSDGE